MPALATGSKALRAAKTCSVLILCKQLTTQLSAAAGLSCTHPEVLSSALFLSRYVQHLRRCFWSRLQALPPSRTLPAQVPGTPQGRRALQAAWHAVRVRSLSWPCSCRMRCSRCRSRFQLTGNLWNQAERTDVITRPYLRVRLLSAEPRAPWFGGVVSSFGHCPPARGLPSGWHLPCRACTAPGVFPAWAQVAVAAELSQQARSADRWDGNCPIVQPHASWTRAVRLAG